MTKSRLARNDGKIVVVARSAAIAKRRGNLAKSLGTEGRDCHACCLAMTESRLARNDGQKMARKDGKIIVIARSKAIAERRRGERVL